MKLRVFLVVLAALLVAAHFLRAAATLPILVCLAAPFLLMVRKRWALRTVQFMTVAGAGIWMVTLGHIVQQRVAEGRSWTVAAIILGSVAAYTLLTGGLLNHSVVKDRYPRRDRGIK